MKITNCSTAIASKMCIVPLCKFFETPQQVVLFQDLKKCKQQNFLKICRKQNPNGFCEKTLFRIAETGGFRISLSQKHDHGRA